MASRGSKILMLSDSVDWTIPATPAAIGADLCAHKIRDRIFADYGPVRLINKGIGGQNSTELLNNTPWNSILAAELVMISVGTNDCPSNVVPVATYEENLRRFIDRVRYRSPDAFIFLFSPTNLSAVTHEPYVEDYRDAAEGIATEKSVGFVDMMDAWLVADNATYLVVDGIHANAPGHQKRYEKAWPIIESEAASFLERMAA